MMSTSLLFLVPKRSVFLFRSLLVVSLKRLVKKNLFSNAIFLVLAHELLIIESHAGRSCEDWLSQRRQRSVPHPFHLPTDCRVSIDDYDPLWLNRTLDSGLLP